MFTISRRVLTSPTLTASSIRVGVLARGVSGGRGGCDDKTWKLVRHGAHVHAKAEQSRSASTSTKKLQKPAAVGGDQKPGRMAHFTDGHGLLSHRDAKRRYLLSSKELAKVESFYRVSDLEKHALDTWGSVVNLVRERERRKKMEGGQLKGKIRNLQEMMRTHPERFQFYRDHVKEQTALRQRNSVIEATRSSPTQSFAKQDRQDPTANTKPATHVTSHYGGEEVGEKRRRRKSWYSEMWHSEGSGKTVLVAIFGNAVVLVSKMIAFAATGSASILSEAIHSFADLGNQILLAIGVRRSQRQPDALHPYGYAHEKYVWALISGVGIFFLGSGVSVYHGITEIISPDHIVQVQIALGSLALAFVVEGATFLFALKEVRAAAKKLDMSFKEYLLHGPDPMGIAVLAEDGAAVTGVTVAASCIGLTHLTGNPIYDGVGSLAVGGLMAFVAVFLIRKNLDILVGRSIPDVHLQRVLKQLQNEKSVAHIKDVKALMLGSDRMRFKAEIDFHGEHLAMQYLSRNIDLNSLLFSLNTPEQLEAFLVKYGAGLIDMLGDEVDRIEAEIKRQNPLLVHVDLEVD